MPREKPGAVTDLLQEASAGSREALDRIIPVVESELRRLASSYLRRERRDHTLQTTALVNEAYIRLVGRYPPAITGSHHALPG